MPDALAFGDRYNERTGGGICGGTVLSGGGRRRPPLARRRRAFGTPHAPLAPRRLPPVRRQKPLAPRLHPFIRIQTCNSRSAAEPAGAAARHAAVALVARSVRPHRPAHPHKRRAPTQAAAVHGPAHAREDKRVAPAPAKAPLLCVMEGAGRPRQGSKCTPA